MAFNSLQFLIFLPCVVMLHWILPHKLRWIMLLAVSLYAYMSWNVWLIFPILGAIIVSYFMAFVIAKVKSKKIKKLCLALTLLVCLGLLIFFKYFNFLVSSITDFINLFMPESSKLLNPVWDILLPVGISFYTFQTLSYVIDVYRGTIKPEKHLGYYALFVVFFPQLVAGPIERPGDMIPQLKEKHKLNSEDMEAGFRWVLSGFIKKVVIADFIASFVDSVYVNYSNANALAILIAAGLFAIQVYCDFAGYSEIAMGAARMLGIRLTRNFDRPFLSLSYGEFIRRWHISLNSWFKDYIYIPLGGGRKGAARKVLNTLVVFALSGLWHGANITYLLWGFYIGFLLCLENALKKPLVKFISKTKININSSGVVLVRRIIFLLLFVPAALIFRATSLADFGLMFVRLFTEIGFSGAYLDSAFASLSMTTLDLVQILLCLVLLY
ncbi:MAG: MBOAT family protein, partial [Clostridia bacterium]|nr:MBOAT family protein [Clostridia bacterium]